MDEEDRPFVCTRGAAAFNIVPRNMLGWMYLALWTVLAIGLGLLYEWVIEGRADDDSVPLIATAALVAALAVWAIAMIRWMYARSVVIDLRDRPGNARSRDRRRP